MLALGLFVIASAMLVQAAFNAIRAYEAVQSDSNHEQLYRFALRTIVAIAEQEEFEDGGEIRLPDDSQVNWEAEIEDTEMVDLFSVKLSLELDGGVGNSSLEAETREYTIYLYRPEWASVDGDRGQLLEDRRQNLEKRRDGYENF